MDCFNLGMLLPLLVVLVVYSSCFSVQAAILSNSTSAADQQSSSAAIDCQHSFKLETVSNALKQIDTAVQNLEEKAHNWAIFRHHIDAWNDQMKALEHKLDLVKRTQDEQQAYGNKLTSLEFTLNHILSKVVYLSDSCHQQMHTDSNAKAAATARKDNGALLYEHTELLGDVKRMLNADKKQKNEMAARLSNILRHVQNIENDSCRRSAATGTNEDNKMAKLMLPVGGCNATQHYNHQLEQTLKKLEQQMTTLASRTPTPKEIKQTNSLTKKNAQLLERVLDMVTNADKNLIQLHDDELRNWRHCQSISGELVTFTGSADLLLKRIEMVMRNVNEKLNKGLCRGKEQTESEQAEGADKEEQPETESDAELDVDIRKDNGDYDTDGNNDDEVDERDMKTTTSNESDENEEPSTEVESSFVAAEFMQPNKIACHELESPRLGGIYKFSTPELNAAGRDFNERLCAFATPGPAWTVIQNRGPYAEQENFNRSWAEYRDGFGALDKDFWFGNEFIHQMVDRDDYELRIELTDFENEQVWAEYSIFRVDSERYNYNLLIGGYRGTVPDAMLYHNEMDFSTYDRRNDKSVDACCACATGYGGGWWFDNCSEANLNGIYHSTPTGHNYVGIIWEKWHGDYSLQKTRMMIRPKNWTNSDVTRDAHGVYNELTEDP